MADEDQITHKTIKLVISVMAGSLHLTTIELDRPVKALTSNGLPATLPLDLLDGDSVRCQF